MTYSPLLDGARARTTTSDVLDTPRPMVRLVDSAGVVVNESNALTISAVWACVGVISSAVAKLPWYVYERLVDEGTGLVSKRLAERSPAYRLLNERPNPEMSSYDFREAMQANVLLWGNAYAEIERNGAGQPVALWPIHPSRVDKDRVRGELRYKISTTGESSLPGNLRGVVYLTSRDVLHIRGLTFNGIDGLSAIAWGRESLGISKAADRYGARFLANDGAAGVVLKHPMKLSPEAAQRLRESWQQRRTGENQHAAVVLEEGMTADRMGVPPDDAQFLETRTFQVGEVCRWFRVPPHKVYELTRATFSNIEHQGMEFKEDTILPWVEKWQQEVNYKLLSDNAQPRLTCEMKLDRLALPTFKERVEGYSKGLQDGWLNPDEIRTLEGYNPLPGGMGQQFRIPVNQAIVNPDGSTTPVGGDGAEPVETDPTDENENQRARAVAERFAAAVLAEVADRERQAMATAARAHRGDTLAAWANGWYGNHRAWCARKLAPVAQAMIEASGGDGDADAVAADWAERHCSADNRLTRSTDPEWTPDVEGLWAAVAAGKAVSCG